MWSTNILLCQSNFWQFLIKYNFAAKYSFGQSDTVLEKGVWVSMVKSIEFTVVFTIVVSETSPTLPLKISTRVNLVIFFLKHMIGICDLQRKLDKTSDCQIDLRGSKLVICMPVHSAWMQCHYCGISIIVHAPANVLIIAKHNP